MIKELIRQVAGDLVKVINFEAAVVSVNMDNDTCVVQQIEGPQIDGVKLKSIISDAQSKLVIYPKVGSYVMCSIIHNMPTECYVSQWGEIDKIVCNCDQVVFNNGEKGGLVNWTDAKAQHDRVKQFISALKNVVTGAPIPEPGNGAASAFQAALNSALASIEEPDFDNLEDTKVKH